MSLLAVYWSKVQEALLNFQFLEEAIKMYLGSAYWIVSRKLNNQVPFKFSYKDVENESLGSLLAKFEKFNSNDLLIDTIRQLIKKRNFCAHRAYLMTAEEQNDDNYLFDEIHKMEAIVTSSKECLNWLMKDLKGIEEVKKNM